MAEKTVIAPGTMVRVAEVTSRVAKRAEWSGEVKSTRRGVMSLGSVEHLVATGDAREGRWIAEHFLSVVTG